MISLIVSRCCFIVTLIERIFLTNIREEMKRTKNGRDFLGVTWAFAASTQCRCAISQFYLALNAPNYRRENAVGLPRYDVLWGGIFR